VLTTEVNSAEVELNKSNIETERNENELTKLTVEYDEASQRLRKLEAELTYLTAKYEFLEKNVHLDDDMKNVRIDELRNIAQSNLVVNSTINDLMGKWEQMRKFSRDSS
jgi:chromosome segregation ATPase